MISPAYDYVGSCVSDMAIYAGAFTQIAFIKQIASQYFWATYTVWGALVVLLFLIALSHVSCLAEVSGSVVVLVSNHLNEGQTNAKINWEKTTSRPNVKENKKLRGFDALRDKMADNDHIKLNNRD